MPGKREKKGLKGGVIIKRYEIVEGRHHGGAWKVAYADFVTAMMAFFLLMWLLNATTEDQRKGLADYFSPNNMMSHASSGTGDPFGGHTAFDKGALVSDRGAVEITTGKRPVIERNEDGDDPVYTETHRSRTGEGVGRGPVADDQDSDVGVERAMGQKAAEPAPGSDGELAGGSAGGTPGGIGGGTSVARDGQPEVRPFTAADVAAENARQEKAAFEDAAQQIKDAVRADPALADIVKQLSIDMTPDGLRIQIIDEVKQPMFQTGSATPNDRARLLIQKVAPVLMKLSQPISIAGHTDAAPYSGPGRSNWELSAERANATRRLLTDSGLPETRVKSVTGNADRDPLLPADPLAAANRRIAILVLRAAPVVPVAAPAGGGVVPAGGVPVGVAPGAPVGSPPVAPAGGSMNLPAGNLPAGNLPAGDRF
jgi:chemotaxis protein MotB